jgi:predicted DNA-binding protein (UPF0251 family)
MLIIWLDSTLEAADNYECTFITKVGAMARPRKCRFVRTDPSVRFYKPQGIPMRQLKIMALKDEELEALLLSDAKGLDQQAAAALMNVSRSTFSRILAQARKTVATALAEGAAIEIGGGDFRLVSDEPIAELETSNTERDA